MCSVLAWPGPLWAWRGRLMVFSADDGWDLLTTDNIHDSSQHSECRPLQKTQRDAVQNSDELTYTGSLYFPVVPLEKCTTFNDIFPAICNIPLTGNTSLGFSLHTIVHRMHQSIQWLSKICGRWLAVLLILGSGLPGYSTAETTWRLCTDNEDEGQF